MQVSNASTWCILSHLAHRRMVRRRQRRLAHLCDGKELLQRDGSMDVQSVQDFPCPCASSSAGHPAATALLGAASSPWRLQTSWCDTECARLLHVPVHKTRHIKSSPEMRHIAAMAASRCTLGKHRCDASHAGTASFAFNKARSGHGDAPTARPSISSPKRRMATRNSPTSSVPLRSVSAATRPARHAHALCTVAAQ